MEIVRSMDSEDGDNVVDLKRQLDTLLQQEKLSGNKANIF